MHETRCTILTMPQLLAVRLASEGGLEITLSPTPVEERQQGSSPVQMLASACLNIPLSLRQLPRVNRFNTASSESPSSTNLPVTPVPVQYLPFVYQLNGTDDATRDLIFALLQERDATGLEIALACMSPRSGALVSEQLGPDCLLAKVNLSTLDEAPEEGFRGPCRPAAMQNDYTESVTVSAPLDFLRLIWELSVVNAEGFYLFYVDAAGNDLPSELFSAAEVGSVPTANVDLVVTFGQPASRVTLQRWHNSILCDDEEIENSSKPIYLSVLDNACVAEPELCFVPGSAALTSPPAGIGQAGTLASRFFHLDSNALPDVRISPSLCRHDDDPLVSIAEWSGSIFNFYLQRGTGASADVVVNARFDPATVVTRVYLSSAANPDQLSVRDQWIQIQDRYQTIRAQLTNPYVHPVVMSSLSAGSLGEEATTRSRLTDFVDNVLAQVASAIATSEPPNWQWQANSVSTSLELPLLFAEIAGLMADITPVTLSIDFTREAPLVTPTAQTESVEVPEAVYSVPPDLNLGIGSPGDLSSRNGGIKAFARSFEDAFAGWDGASGVLKLARRADIGERNGESLAESFWVVRWSLTAGLSVQFQQRTVPPDESIAYFARRPLSTSLIFQQVRVGSPEGAWIFTDVDIDAWADSFLCAFDAFLAPDLAVAIAILDDRNGTTFYSQLLACKRRLSQVVPCAMLPVFRDQVGFGKIDAARMHLAQGMLVSLSSAYRVSSIVQAAADVRIMGSGTAEHPPQLYGSISPPDTEPVNGSASPAALNQYKLLTSELGLQTGLQWLTTRVNLERPAAQSELTLPLSYKISFLQHDFQTTQMGYTPSAWLKFVLPGDAILSPTVTQNAQIPVPLLVYPASPLLLSQTASLSPPASPPRNDLGIEGEIAALLKWNYDVEIACQCMMQDQLFFEVTFNEVVLYDNPDDPILPTMAPSGERTIENLFHALALYQLGQPALLAQVGVIGDEAYPNNAKPQASGAAHEIIGQFVAIANAVEAAWPDYSDTQRKTETFVPVIAVSESYCIQFSAGGVLSLYGHGQNNTAPMQWPVLIVGEHFWEPDAQSAITLKDDADQTWYKVSLSSENADQPDFHSAVNMTISWQALDLRQRKSARFSAWIKRNAELVLGRPTTADFVYITERVEFANPVLPLLTIKEISIMQPANTLAGTIEQMLCPFHSFVQGPDVSMKFTVQYRFVIAADSAGRPSVAATVPVLLVPSMTLDPGISFTATQLATQIGSWHANLAPSRQGAVLVFALTIFTGAPSSPASLVSIESIPFDVHAQSTTWWTGS